MVVSLAGTDDSRTDPGQRNNSSLKAGAFTRTLEPTAAGRVGNAGARLIDRHASAHARGRSGMDVFYKDLIDLIIKLALALYGAIWAYYLIRVLRQRELARITESKGIEEIEKLRIEISTLAVEKGLQIEKIQLENNKLAQEILQLQRNQQRTTNITVALDATVVRNPDGQGFVVLGAIELFNQGNQDIRFPWEDQEPPVRMSRVRFKPDGQPEFGTEAQIRVRMTRQPSVTAPAHIIRAGGKEAVVFAVHAPAAGLYLLMFRAEGAPLAPDQAAKPHTGRPLPWTASKYVLVSEAHLPPAAELQPAA